MNENYIDIVRKSLYDTSKQTSPSSKKIVFQQYNYKSENIFEDIFDDVRNTNKPKNKIALHNIGICNKKKSKASQEEQIKQGGKIKKKTQVNQNFNFKTNKTVPKSEINNISLFCKSKNSTILNNQNDESDEEFDVDTFFKTRDHSFNESITEAHSGIDYEFVSDCKNNVKITGSKYRNLNDSFASIEIAGDSDSFESNKDKRLPSSKEIAHIENEGASLIKLKRKKCSSRSQESSESLSNSIVCKRDKNRKINDSQTKSKRERIKLKKTARNSEKIENEQSDDFIKRTKDFKEKRSTFNEFEETVLSIENSTLNESIIHKNKFNDGLIDTDSSYVDFLESIPQIKVKQNNETHVVKNTLLPIILDVNDYSETISKIIVLKKNMYLPFYGMFALEVLHGQVEVLGSILNKKLHTSKLFSPRGSPLLSLKNISDDKTTTLKQLLPNSNVEDIPIDNTTAVIKCTRITDNFIFFVDKYISQQLFPKFGNNSPLVNFQLKEDWNILITNDLWNNIINNVNPSTKLFIVGGKGVGKSTFLRYAINKLLMKYGEIRVVDLDPGQSEFFVPGCISVLNIKEPVFGPNYTHLRNPDKSILSDINIGHNPSAYIKCVASLMEYISELDKLPTLINYMGFSQGIGIKIVSSAISYIQPTDIVQINSANYKKNFSKDLNLNTVKENCDFFGGNTSILNFNLHVISSMSDQKVGGWSLEPRQVREMCVLAYLGRMMKDNITTLTDHELPMFKINLSTINLINTEKEVIPPAAVNANLVALCNLEDTNDFCCYGYGIVRGVDLENGYLVLITPEPIEILEKVYYLVLGSVSLPPSVYMMPENVTGLIPYVMEGELEFLGQITKRTYLPVGKR